jgi:short-subunit dehydrogenase
MSEDLKGRTALVTGASSGIGADFARELAGRGAALVLVARRAEALQRLAGELEKSGTQARVAPADLSDPAARNRLHAELEASGTRIDILVNNAGFGVFGPFVESDWSRVAAMLEVDVVALTHLTHLFLPGMLAGSWGRILLVASTAAFQPTPVYAVYGAGKAYVLSFGIALHQELRRTGVSCTTICPGPTETEFFQVAGQRETMFHRLSVMPSQAVARQGITAMLARRPSAVAGRMNALMALSTRLTPRGWAAGIAHAMMKN